jgi:hypothetical protein
MTIWEYKIIVKTTEEKLNALGREGWELVAVAVTAMDYAHSDAYSIAYLKRRKD